ncbi:amino acid adenylation domain-containing protein [Microbulbifer sp. CnH-101-G]|uniref:amino acid adenylation domain-containing protein n=1 Tax=Microbulbifer sp. CnH-101-G TaxID=3243393 RepID=UPI00403A6E69
MDDIKEYFPLTLEQMQTYKAFRGKFKYNCLAIELPKDSLDNIKTKIVEKCSRDDIFYSEITDNEDYDIPIQFLKEEMLVEIDVHKAKNTGEIKSIVQDIISSLEIINSQNIFFKFYITDDNLHLVFIAPSIKLDLASMLNFIDCLSSETKLENQLQYFDYLEWQDEILNGSFSKNAKEFLDEKITSPNYISWPFGNDGLSTSGNIEEFIHLSESLSLTTAELYSSWADYLYGLFEDNIKPVLRTRAREDSSLDKILGCLELSVPSLLLDMERPNLIASDAVKYLDFLPEHNSYIDYFSKTPAFSHILYSSHYKLNFLIMAETISPLSLVVINNSEYLYINLTWDKSPIDHKIATRLIYSWLSTLFSRDQYSIENSNEIENLSEIQGKSIEYTATFLDNLRNNADRKPYDIAIRDGHFSVNYRELDLWSDSLATHLLKKDLGPIVAVWATKQVESLISFIACYKSGISFLPIDPSYPIARIQYILDNSGATCILINDKCTLNHEIFCDIISVNTFRYDNALVKQVPNYNKPAYLIYTSGSTGEPKGVSVTRSNLEHYIQWASDYYYDNKPLNSAVFSSLAFDLSITNIFCPLNCGGTVSLFSDDYIGDSLYKALDPGNNINIVKLTPTHLNLVKVLGLIKTDLNKVIVGGEQLYPHQVSYLEELNKEICVFNEYGPTETTVGCIVKRVTGKDKKSLIGSPIANTSALLLDKDGNIVPSGKVGELYISGPGVTAGYLHDTELTNSKFVLGRTFKNDVINKYHKLFRTGDFCRLLPNQEFEFLGRADSQVKHRGYRISLLEIESILNRYPSVVNSITLIKDANGNDILFSYIEVTSDNFNINLLHEHCCKYLPPFMVPEDYLVLKEFPRTDNGKIDRNALISLSDNKKTSDVDTNSITIINKTLKKLLSEAVGSSELIGSDDYFELGGDSIKAIRFLTRIYEELNIKISIRELYENSTVSKLDKLIASKKTNIECSVSKQIFNLKYEKDFHELNVDSVESVFYIPDISFNMIQKSYQLKDHNVYHIRNVYHVKIENFCLQSMEESLSHVVSKNESLRSFFDIYNYPKPVQIVNKEIKPLISYYDFSQNDFFSGKNEIDKLLLDELNTPFIIDKAPLWRLSIFRTSINEYLFSWSFHHAILDGWSNSIIINDLAQTYSDIRAGTAPRLSRIRASLLDYISEQEKIKSDNKYRLFWADYLHGSNWLWLSDKINYTNNIKPLNIVEELSPSTYNKLSDISKRFQVDIKTVCSAIFSSVLSEFSYFKDFTYSIGDDTRPIVSDAEYLTGCFTQAIPLRIRQDYAFLSWSEKIEYIKSNLARIKHFGKLSLSDIAQSSNLDFNDPRSMQVMFVFVNFHSHQHAEHGYHEIANSSFSGFENTSVPIGFTTSTTNNKLEVALNIWCAEESHYLLLNIFKAYINELIRVSGLENLNNTFMGMNNSKNIFPVTREDIVKVTKDSCINSELFSLIEVTQTLSYALLDQNKRILPASSIGKLHLALSPAEVEHYNLENIIEIELFDSSLNKYLFDLDVFVSINESGQIKILTNPQILIKNTPILSKLKLVENVLNESDFIETAYLKIFNESTDNGFLFFVKINHGYKLNVILDYIYNKLSINIKSSQIIEVDEFPLLSDKSIDTNHELFSINKYLVLSQSSNDDVTSFLLNSWEELLGCKIEEMNLDVYSLGAHSLLFVKLLVSLTKKYNLTLELAEIMSAKTISLQSSLIANKIYMTEMIESLQEVCANESNVEVIV